MTSKGIPKKSTLTNKFIAKKKKEYVLSKEEIAKLERDAGLHTKSYNRK